MYSTLLFVNPTVSSKSKTEIPFGVLENLGFNDFVTASVLLAFWILYVLENFVNPLPSVLTSASGSKLIKEYNGKTN